MQQTSINAYIEEQNNFQTREKKVYNKLKEFPHGITDSELMFKMGYSHPNMVRPRRNALCKKGIVFSCGKRKCNITNKKVKIWKVK